MLITQRTSTLARLHLLPPKLFVHSAQRPLSATQITFHTAAWLSSTRSFCQAQMPPQANTPLHSSLGQGKSQACPSAGSVLLILQRRKVSSCALKAVKPLDLCKNPAALRTYKEDGRESNRAHAVPCPLNGLLYSRSVPLENTSVYGGGSHLHFWSWAHARPHCMGADRAASHTRIRSSFGFPAQSRMISIE